MAGKDEFPATLARGDGADPEVFTAVPGITDLQPPQRERDVYDVTARDSSQDANGMTPREFVGSKIVDNGEIEATVNWVVDTHMPLADAMIAADAENYEITFASGAKVGFAAIFTTEEGDLPMEDKAEATLTWRVSGPVTFTAAA